MKKENINVPTNLFNKVMLRINKEKKLQIIRRRIFISISSFVLLIYSAIPILKNFQNEISQSSFIDYTKLLISDFGSVLNNWQEFGLSLLESLPVISIMLTLLVLWGLLLTARFAVNTYQLKLKY